MKSRIVKISTACITVLVIVGCTTTVTSETLTTTEVINNQDDKQSKQNSVTQIFYINSGNDLNNLYEALKNRNGKSL